MAGGESATAGAFALSWPAADNEAQPPIRTQSSLRMKRPDFSADALMIASGAAGQDLPPSSLYIVATPIGNAADITLRALWVLSQVDAIGAEDTRNSTPLLQRYGIRTPLVAVHEHNERAAAQTVIARLRAGQRMALITDAGTPAISDPGARLVRAVLDAGLRVVPIPGASALTAAASAAGLRGDRLTFAGFPSAGKRTREQGVRELAARGEAFVLFEAPHRVADTAVELAATLEAGRRVIIARELTKKFESFQVCAAAGLPAAVGAEPRGEYVLLIDAAEHPDETDAPVDATTRRWLALLAEVLPASRTAALAAKATGLPRDRLYALIARR
jgi:16S rRNA (cytidine1402-2'-O)-methyltransferase